MFDIFLPFASGAIQFGWKDIVDIIIVAVIIYALIRINTISMLYFSASQMRAWASS